MSKKKKKSAKKVSKQPKKGLTNSQAKGLHGQMWLPKKEFLGELEEGER